MVIDAALVLEGGGARCVFTAGVLDYFMEKDIYFKYVYSVSASAYIALNYKSKQIKRAKRSNIDFMKKEDIFTLRSFFKTGSVFNTGLLFDRLPNKEIPFDYDTFFKSEQRLTMSVTNLLTGEPTYISEYKDNKHLMEVCKCSNCFPIITPIQYMEDQPVLDGGMADAIPVEKALNDGHEKCVVILTQQKGFRKKEKKNLLLSLRYHRYKNFVKTVNSRPAVYNRTLDRLMQLEQEGKIYAIYPGIDTPKLIDRDIFRLEEVYYHGYEYAKEQMRGMFEYLGISL